MARRLTDRELDVMRVLWARGPSTVAEVRRELADELAYTTVLTILRTLEAKAIVAHEDAGRAHRYSARVTKDAAERTALKRLVDRVFGGSAERLLTHLVAERDLSPAELKRLRAILDSHATRRRKR
jgi:predicted transcriptional regulator